MNQNKSRVQIITGEDILGVLWGMTGTMRMGAQGPAYEILILDFGLMKVWNMEMQRILK